MLDDPSNYELVHYGVKGMKWGVRKEDDVAKRKRVTEREDSTKSKHRVRLEAKYHAKGMNASDAAMAAEKRIKTEKILAISAGVVVTGALAVAGKHRFDQVFKDIDLDVGATLTNINAMGDKQNLDRRLYVTTNNADANKYRGLLAKTLRNNAKRDRSLSDTIYEQSLKATERIKAPSHMQAKKLYAEYRKREWAKGSIADLPPDYRVFNRNLVASKDKTFYNFLESKGYNAILDSNDQFISGFNTKHPLILFNAKSSTAEAGRKIVNEQLTNKLAKRQISWVLAKQSAPMIGVGAGYIYAQRDKKTRAAYSKVEEYFKEHPNSERSYADVYAEMSKPKRKRT